MSAVLLNKQGPFHKACMASLKSLYPKGVNSAEQHRDLIKVFLSGWASGMLENNQPFTEAFKKETLRIVTDPNWWPGDDWCWWK